MKLPERIQDQGDEPAASRAPGSAIDGAVYRKAGRTARGGPVEMRKCRVPLSYLQRF